MRGLSPFSNPIEAGIDSFAKISNVFAQNDRMEMERQDHARRAKIADMQLQEMEQEKPIRDLERQNRKLKAEHEVFKPHIASAMMKNEQAKSTGKAPEYSPQEIDAILHLNEEATYLDNDPQKSIHQVAALHNLQQTMAQVTPNLVKYAQSLPEGQRKVRISDQNAPGVVENFNQAFGKLMGGKTANSFLIDMDSNTLTPILDAEGPDGKMSPLTKKTGDQEHIHQIPLSMLQGYINNGSAFGSLLLPAMAQLDGNEKMLAEVKKAGDQRQFSQAKAKVLAGLNAEDAPVKLRKQYTEKMGDLGYNVTPAEVKELFPDNKSSRSGLAGKITMNAGKRVYIDDEGNPSDVEAPPEDEEMKKLKREEIKSRIDSNRSKEEDRKEKKEEKQSQDEKDSKKQIDTALKNWKDDVKAYETAKSKGEDTADELRGKQNESRRVYEDLVDEHTKNFKKTYAPGSPRKARGGLATKEAQKRAPLANVKAAVATATNKQDAIAILKRQGYTHDENGNPL